ncbi:hypothetical protein [Acidovorax sp.]|uniref:hypothetical protein n=1 Tax=Acidovorax sp. TaxID=1872122 RepID=UPI002ACE62E0|nr:hypothetical protein [Acidovorax sp.]MDZ7861562.1 hypothetical protein [Acidovorax sp.]
MTTAGVTNALSLLDFATNSPLPFVAGRIVVEVPEAYLTDERFEHAGIEGLAIQRLLTLANSVEYLNFSWSVLAAKRIISSPAVYPLAAVALCLKNASHECVGEESITANDFLRAQQKLLSYRLSSDMFSDRQALVCLDYQNPSLPFDLYDESSKRLRREDEFESLVEDLLFAQRGAGFKAEKLPNFRLPLAVMLHELMENTDDHARTNYDGSVLRPNAVRGMLVKRIFQYRKLPTRESEKSPPIPCLEFTVFDSGIGYYNSYRRQLMKGQARGEPVEVGDRQAEIIRKYELGAEVPMDVEYAILQKCLSRHSNRAIPDPRPGHRGLGLYEVLRSLKMMQGMFEVRTGRIHGYRSFLSGEIQLQLEPETSKDRPGMPKASLLDATDRFSHKLTSQQLVRGTVVRIVVPLI